MSQEDRFVVQEFDEEPPPVASSDASSAAACIEYQVSSLDGRIVIEEQTTSHDLKKQRKAAHALKKILFDLFLPIGYPKTVQDGYLEYQLYDSLQGLCSYLRGVLCTAAVLEAAGVGDTNATALSAALIWASRDGLAMLGGLAYSYFASRSFDAHVKEFRLFADVINDVGFLLDMLAPVFGRQHLLLVSSAAVLCKTLCGISAGATKSSITQHFAVAGNMADLNAKEATQETAVSLLGMILGIKAARYMQTYEQGGADSASQESTMMYLNWTIFMVLTVIHVWANWVGVKLLRMRTLNRARADLVLSDILTEVCSCTREKMLDDKARVRLRLVVEQLPPPTQVNESILVSAYDILFSGSLTLGVPLVRVLKQRQEKVLAMLKTLTSNGDKYAVAINDSNNRVLVSVLVGANARDELKAYLHASALARCKDYSCARAVECLFDDDDFLVKELCKKGWDTERFYFGFTRRRSRLTNTSTQPPSAKKVN